MPAKHLQVLSRGVFLGRARSRVEVGPFALGFWTADAGAEPPAAHGHPDPHLMFVVAGRYRTDAAGETPGGRTPLIYNPADTFHRDGFEAGPCSFFSVSIARDQVVGIADARTPERPCQIADPAPRAVLYRLLREYAGWTPDADLALESLSAELLLALCPTPAPKARPAWLKRVYERLADQSCARDSLDDLGKAAGVHPFHVTRAFRAAYGATPGEFVRARRLEKAAEQLTRSRTPLAEIAAGCGFSDQSHFARRFRQTYGFTPGAYRAMVTGRRP